MNFGTNDSCRLFFKVLSACPVFGISLMHISEHGRKEGSCLVSVSILFHRARGPVVLLIVNATELVNLYSLLTDFFQIRIEISVFEVLLVRDPFLLGQMDFQKVRLDRSYDPGNSRIPRGRGSHSSGEPKPRAMYASVLKFIEKITKRSQHNCCIRDDT